MKVVALKKDNEFWSVTPGKEYVVIGIDHESYRILDDKSEPILFPKEGFQVVDDSIPQEWVWDRYSLDEYYGDPQELHTPGFYEDYFDGKQEALERFRNYLRKAGLDK